MSDQMIKDGGLLRSETLLEAASEFSMVCSPAAGEAG